MHHKNRGDNIVTEFNRVELPYSFYQLITDKQRNKELTNFVSLFLPADAIARNIAELRGHIKTY